MSLINEQVHIDAMMHMKRLTEPKTHREVVHGNGFQGYVDGLKGYFNSGYRWNDGDSFLINDINHPIMGAVSSRVYTNHDRRCAGVGYGERGYWSCVGRAKPWPTLDRHLSGNLAARILKNAVKVLTDPSGMANAAFNLNFDHMLASRPFGSKG